MNGRHTLQEYLNTFKITPTRALVWDAIVVVSLLSVVFFFTFGKMSMALQSIFITAISWYAKQMELEISKRNAAPDGIEFPVIQNDLES